jgi:hypothetical protein
MRRINSDPTTSEHRAWLPVTVAFVVGVIIVGLVLMAKSTAPFDAGTAVEVPGGQVPAPAVPSPIPAPTPSPPAPQAPLAGEFPDSLLGLELAVAEQEADRLGFTVRVIAVDGEEFIVTTDYLADRVNVRLQGGQVVEVGIG